MRSTTRGLLVLAVLLVASACGTGREVRVHASGSPRRLTHPTPVFAADGVLLDGPSSESARIKGSGARSPLLGMLAPLGVTSPDGRSVLYQAWHAVAEETCGAEPGGGGSRAPKPLGRSPDCRTIAPDEVRGRPSLWLYDLDNGADTRFEDGAQSVAWRADGAIAYFKGLAPDVLGDIITFVGQILVRPSRAAEAAAWTLEPGRYVAVGWAGDALLAYRQHGESLEVLVLDGPGLERTLARDAGIVAISPDGTKVLLVHSAGSEGGAALELVQVADGASSARVELSTTLDPATRKPVDWLLYGGSWTGDRVVAEGGPGLTVWTVRGSALRFERTLLRAGPDYPMGIHEPQLVGEDGVLAWAPVPGRGGRARGVVYVPVECRLSSGVCTRGQARRELVFGSVRNPSRPSAAPAAVAVADAGER